MSWEKRALPDMTLWIGDQAAIERRDGVPLDLTLEQLVRGILGAVGLPADTEPSTWRGSTAEGEDLVFAVAVVGAVTAAIAVVVGEGRGSVLVGVTGAPDRSRELTDKVEELAREVRLGLPAERPRWYLIDPPDDAVSSREDGLVRWRSDDGVTISVRPAGPARGPVCDDIRALMPTAEDARAEPIDTGLLAGELWSVERGDRCLAVAAVDDADRRYVVSIEGPWHVGCTARLTSLVRSIEPVPRRLTSMPACWID